MNINLKMIFVAIILGLSSCSSKGVDTQEEIVKQVFEILKTFDSMDIDDYPENFISADDIIDIGMPGMEGLNQDALDNEMIQGYWKVKSRGDKYGIDWENIKYLSFEESTFGKDREFMVDGFLFFESNKNIFKVGLNAVSNGDGYQLVGIYKPKHVERIN